MNPWAALMTPIRSRPGNPLPEVPELADKALTNGEQIARAAAAVVVTDTGIFDRPDVRLVPVIAIDFQE